MEGENITIKRFNPQNKEIQIDNNQLKVENEQNFLNDIVPLISI